MRSADALMAAVRHHQAGQLAEADRLYRKVLAAEPDNFHALHLRGALAHAAGRNDEAVELIGRALALNEPVPDFHYNIGLALWALGRAQDAVVHWARAVALNPNFAAAHTNLGLALREDGRFAAAETHLRRAMQLQPQSPQAHNNLGLVLASRGDRDAALHYQRAIDLQPGFIEPYLNLAVELTLSGRSAEALACLRRSLQLKELPENKELFARVIGTHDPREDHGALRSLIIRAAREGWGRPENLAPVAVALLRHGSAIEDCIERAERAWPMLPPARELFGQSGLAAVANEPLLRWLLESAVIADLDLERFLTACRLALLEIAETAPHSIDGELLGFAAALARQCYVNEYVYAASDEERERVAQLRESLLADLASDSDTPPVWLAVVAAYEPIYELPNAEVLFKKHWPPALETLLTQQVIQPKEEAQCRVLVEQLTPIEDAVSRLVQRQYEQNPYPRWIALVPPQKYDSLDTLMRREFPHAPYRRLGARALDILIAGCGTGQHSISVAQQFDKSNVLAIDLSKASLGYALARTRALNVTNVRYAQADILKLGAIERTFDIIQVAGVLHHLADPWAGWQTLLPLLRPNGCMYIGLYSEIARRDVVAARGFIAERRYGSAPADIRACRQELAAAEPGTPLHNVSNLRDFFTTSECRDLLFHVEEHRMTLPGIKSFLAANGLQFLGFDLDLRLLQQYAARFPQDKAMIDLDNWDAFEQDSPSTFVAMYKFWVQKVA